LYRKGTTYKIEMPNSIFYTLRVTEETDSHIVGIDKFEKERILKKDSIEQAWPVEGKRHEGNKEHQH